MYNALWNREQKAPHIETIEETRAKRERAELGGYQKQEEKWEVIHKGSYEECSTVLKKKWKQYYK